MKAGDRAPLAGENGKGGTTVQPRLFDHEVRFTIAIIQTCDYTTGVRAPLAGESGWLANLPQILHQQINLVLAGSAAPGVGDFEQPDVCLLASYGDV